MVRCNALYKKNGNWQHTYSSDQKTEHPRKIFVPQEWVVCNVYLQNTSSKIFSSNTLTVSTRSQHHPTNCSVLPRRYFVWDCIYPQRFGTSSLSHDILITNHERRKSSSTDQKSSDQIHQGRFHERIKRIVPPTCTFCGRVLAQAAIVSTPAGIIFARLTYYK